MSSRLALIGLSIAPFGFTFEPDTPENQGMSSGALIALREYSESFASKTGLVVLRNDKVVIEHYTGGTSQSSAFAMKSVTKSFGAGLLVKALDDGLLSLTDPGCSHPDEIGRAHV